MAKTATTMGIDERGNHWSRAYSAAEWGLLVMASLAQVGFNREFCNLSNHPYLSLLARLMVKEIDRGSWKAGFDWDGLRVFQLGELAEPRSGDSDAVSCKDQLISLL